MGPLLDQMSLGPKIWRVCPMKKRDTWCRKRSGGGGEVGTEEEESYSGKKREKSYFSGASLGF